MIITVTLNPSLDRAVDIDELRRGDVIRATSARLDPGGKGVNVSRALLANGVPSRAVVPCGGDEGSQLVRLLKAEGVDPLTVPISGRTRSNLTLAEPDGTVTKINEPGPELSAAEFEAVIEQVEAIVRPLAGVQGAGSPLAGPEARALAGVQGAGSPLAGPVEQDWVVVCGSAPPGLPAGSFARLCRRLAAAGARLAVDTSGPPLREAAEAGAALVKPNLEELAEVVGRPLASLDDVVNAAEELRRWGADAVLASLGADGAVLVTGAGVVAGECPVSRRISTVGAGDSLLAGFLAATTRDIQGVAGQPDENSHTANSALGAALAEGLAWGAAAVSLPGSRMPGPADLHREDVRINECPDRRKRLLIQG